MQKEEILHLMQNQQIDGTEPPAPPEMVDFSMQSLQEVQCQTAILASKSMQTQVWLKILFVA